MNQANLLLRLLLEIVALVLLGMWGWEYSGWLLGFGLPILAVEQPVVYVAADAQRGVQVDDVGSSRSDDERRRVVGMRSLLDRREPLPGALHHGSRGSRI